MAGSHAAFQITIANESRTIACASDQTILQAAIAAGIDYPYACATGNCATCISKIDNGTVSLLPRADAALRDAQIKTGLTLACRAQPRSDVTITWLARTAN
ncbi:MAG TPA: 2Fe-2S iron-sulfur cluster-binding protein [Vineibacter sp.]|nr:2Fe-2S iron-sulfur cluster-binding protein [Vineibacter sp.]